MHCDVARCWAHAWQPVFLPALAAQCFEDVSGCNACPIPIGYARSCPGVKTWPHTTWPAS